MTSDVDDNGREFCTGEPTVEGLYGVRPGKAQAVSRALAYTPYADLVCCGMAMPDLLFAREFAGAVHAMFPGKLLADHCSPSFNWKRNFDDATIARFQKELSAMGYKFRFIALAGLQSLNYPMPHLARSYARYQMTAFAEPQEAGFAAAEKGFTVGHHHSGVGMAASIR